VFNTLFYESCTIYLYALLFDDEFKQLFFTSWCTKQQGKPRQAFSTRAKELIRLAAYLVKANI